MYKSNLTLYARWERAEPVTVTYKYLDGREDGMEELEYASTVSDARPEREGYIFSGWYLDEELTLAFNSHSQLTSDLTLYAKWDKDPLSLANEIATRYIDACFRVKTLNYGFGGSSVFYGSAAVYKLEGDGYLCLTNAHCVEPDERYSHVKYSVFDPYGNEYDAYVVAMDTGYDLAVLRFSAPKGIIPLELSDTDAEKGELVVSVGNPGGLLNAVTYGYVERYRIISDLGSSDGIEVEFEVGWHNAPVDHGSSGGAVLNSSAELVGINFAASNDKEGNFAVSYFIPVSRVREFLAENGCE